MSIRSAAHVQVWRRHRVAVIVVLVCVAIATPAYTFASREVHTTRIPPGRVVSVQARCPVGQHVLFGGATLVKELYFLGMHRTPDGGAWAVDAKNLGGNVPRKATAVAYCGAGAVATKVTKTKTLEDLHTLHGSFKALMVRCPKGSVLVGGGMASGGAAWGHAYRALQRVGTDVWRVDVGIAPSTQGRVTVTAVGYCAPGSAPKLASHTVTIAAGRSGTARAACPGHTRLAFGGYTAQQGIAAPGYFPGSVQPITFKATSTTIWSVVGLNRGEGPAKLTALAYCR